MKRGAGKAGRAGKARKTKAYGLDFDLYLFLPFLHFLPSLNFPQKNIDNIFLNCYTTKNQSIGECHVYYKFDFINYILLLHIAPEL